jgi:peroxiredoxin
MDITFLYWEECMSHEEALQRVRQVMAEEGVQAPVNLVKVETWEQAKQWQFIGSPTIVVDGKDIQPPPPGASSALTCRTYYLEDGRVSPLPSLELIRRALSAGRTDEVTIVKEPHECPVITKGAIMAALKLNEQAKPFTLPDVDDKTHTLSDYKDNEAVVVIFSCNYCPYVKAWEDRMVQIQADYASQGVQLLVINANDVSTIPDDSFPKMKARATEKGFNFPYLFDESQAVARAYGAERTPEVFVFDKQGQLRYHGAIDDNNDNPGAVKDHYLRAALDAVLGAKPLSVSNTQPVGCTIKWK